MLDAVDYILRDDTLSTIFLWLVAFSGIGLTIGGMMCLIKKEDQNEDSNIL